MSILTNTSLFVTGGTGTFGRAFVRRALDVGASRIVIFSRDELKQAQMRQHFADDRLRFFVGDVRDLDRLTMAMRGSEIVVHAAAMKRVEACELHPWEADATNNRGSRNVALAAISAGVNKALLTSSDKACAPLSFYGISKAAAERHFTTANVYAAGTKTRLLATRYGNVLGSRGSVLDVWRAQMAAGQPLRITDKRCTRFWMSIADAVWLVETALRDGRGGEIFVPKIGAAPLVRLAEALCGDARPDFTETALGRVEKLHETLITEDEARTAYSCDDYFIIEPERTWEHLPPLAKPKVAEGFVYRSDRNAWQHTEDDLLRFIHSQGED